MTQPRLTPLARNLPDTVPFVGPEMRERATGEAFAARLGANECVFGPSPKAKAAMIAALDTVWQYPDAVSLDLRMALAAKWGCDVSHIVMGEGIDGLLGTLVRLLVGPGDAVVTSDGAYPTFNYHVAGYGGTLHKLPYRDDHEDLEALVARAAEVDAKLVYLANPDNPMGSYIRGDAIEAALERLPEGCLLLLDEAYAEFAPAEAIPQIAPDDPRVFRTRTFSKAYGLAGARVGYGVGAAPLVKAFDKVRNHFGMNRMGLAGALAALQDHAYLQEICARTAAARAQIGEIAQANGLRALPSATNFVAIDCGADGAFAKRVLDGLVARGLFVRMPFVAPLDRCVRISCGTPENMALLGESLPQALAEAQK